MEDLFRKEYAELKEIESVLPDAPDEEAINNFLHNLRLTVLYICNHCGEETSNHQRCLNCDGSICYSYSQRRRSGSI